MKPVDTFIETPIPTPPVRSASVSAPADAPARSEDTAPEIQAPAVPSAQELERMRQAQAEQAARVIADYFVVSDVRFTIFKDASGQYVTRFTSLQDGTVHYIPEPNLIKLYAQLTGKDPSLLQLKV